MATGPEHYRAAEQLADAAAHHANVSKDWTAAQGCAALAQVHATLALAAADNEAPADQSDRCPRCLCGDCGGRLDQHTQTSCSCESCTLSPSFACRLPDFLPDFRIGFIEEQLGPLLSVWLGEKQQRRCRAVAHAAHHALHDYDQHRETP